jgi:hypothetical protein
MQTMRAKCRFRLFAVNDWYSTERTLTVCGGHCYGADRELLVVFVAPPVDEHRG